MTPRNASRFKKPIPTPTGEDVPDALSGPAPYPRRYMLYYAPENFLQKLTAIIPRAPSPADFNRYWIIYIHGGAWRDPEIRYDSFFPTFYRLREDSIAEHIAGYASVSYGLSPHPSYPERPGLPETHHRWAKHPDHIHDVVKALLYLQDKYNFQDRYILVGHSCGATLAFQAVMKDVPGTDAKLWEGLKLPKAIIGLEGIYDIPALLHAHQEIPVYKEFIETAFGSDEETWEFASPTAGIYQNTWTNGVLAIVGHSGEDELVEKNQAELIRGALQDWRGRETLNGKKRLLLVDHGLKGKHDEIWQKGEETRDLAYLVASLPPSILSVCNSSITQLRAPLKEWLPRKYGSQGRKVGEQPSTELQLL